MLILIQVEEQGGVLDRDMGNYVLEDTRLSTLQKKLTKELFILIFSFWGLYKPFKIKTFFSQKKKNSTYFFLHCTMCVVYISESIFIGSVT